MNLTRRQFVGCLTGAAVLVAVGGTTGCATQADITKILNLLPMIGGIVTTVGTVLASVDPAIALPITMALAIVKASFAIIEGILTQYQSNIPGIPQTILGTLDAAAAAIGSALTSIEALFPNLSASVKSALGVAIATFQAVLGFIASLIPSVMASSFPKAAAMFSARHITIGASVIIPTARAFAQNYNAKMDKAWGKDKKCHIHVPWVKWGDVPVAP